VNILALALGFFGTGLALFFLSLKALLYVCQPNQVLVFSGSFRSVGGRRVGYRIVKGGNAWRRPFIERVDSIDLTNMIIELSAQGAYAKGGIPLNVQGVANVKIAGHEPVLNNAIERFLGKSRAEVMGIAKATLEGSLRGVLATLTPEQINEDRNLFAEKLVQEVEQDMTALGLIVDTLKIQNITDDVKYLDSIGRIRNAELLSNARIAEAVARADSIVRMAENQQQEVSVQIQAQIEVAKAESQRQMTDALTRRDAVVAEEKAAVAALVAQAQAEIEVQKARVEQIRRKLEADVLAPAKAECEAIELKAKAAMAPIIEDGRAKAEALKKLAKSWSEAGDQAREIFLMQKLVPIIAQITDLVASTKVEKMTVIDTKPGTGGFDARRLVAVNEQIRELFGVDLAEALKKYGEKESSTAPAGLSVEAAPGPTQGE
jgi:flotillin